MMERPVIGQGLFLTNGRAVNYQRVCTNQTMDTLMEYTCLSILPAFPRVGGKPDHVSSQGKEAIFAMHDIYVMHQQDCLLLSQLCLTFPSSMDGARNRDRLKWPCPLELDNRTPPATLDRAQFGA